MRSIAPSRRTLRTIALMATALLAGTTAKADTGYSGLFTIDLRTSLDGTVLLERIDDTRSPLALETRPGDALSLYFTLKKATGEPLPATRFDCPLKLTGAASTAADTFAWSVPSPGVVRLTVRPDSLRFSTNPARLVFPQGSGYARVDDSPVTVGNRLPDVTLRSVPSPFRDLYGIFAADSAGNTGLIGEGTGAPKASIEAARLSVKGSAGVGLSLELGPDGSVVLERRTSLAHAGLFEMPSVELKAVETFEVSGPSIAAGGERGGELGQRIVFAGSDAPSDEARVTITAFFLETASLAGVLAPSPFIGLVQRAAVETALQMAGAASLLSAARRETWAGAAAGGRLSAEPLSVDSPVASNGVDFTTPLGLSVASADGVIGARSALRYDPSEGGTTPAGLENRWALALSGSGAPANWEVQLGRVFGPAWVDDHSFESGVLARLGASGNLLQAGVDLSVQASPEGDLERFRTEDRDGFDVRIRVNDTPVLESLRTESAAQLGPLVGEPASVLHLSRELADSTAKYIVDRAEALAPAGTVALVAEADRRSGRVRTDEFELDLWGGRRAGEDDVLSFHGGWEQSRLVENAVRTCRAGGQSWDLGTNPSTGSWEAAPSLAQLLSDRLLANVGPLIETALQGLLGSVSKNLGLLDGRGAPAPLTTEPLDVDDPTTGRRGGRATFPESYGGWTATLRTGDPSRPEASGRPVAAAASVRRTLTTRRVFAGPVPPSRRAATAMAAASSTRLTLIGNFVSLEMKPSGGVAPDPLPAPVSLAVDLYADQMARMGAHPELLAEAKLFRYDAGIGAWQLAGGSLSGDRTNVTASVTRPGTYAPGVLEEIPAGDSDGDGLLDSEEDRNGNGIIDAGESDPYAWDSDGDGVNDADERAKGTDPMVAASAPNRPPVLGTLSNRRLSPAQNLSFVLRATDPDGDPVSFSAEGLPPGASLNSSTGAFAFTPEQAGTWRIAFTVTDTPRTGGPLSDTGTMLLEVQRIAADDELTALTRAVPIVLDVLGVNSSHYTTELVLTNRGATAVSMTYRYEASIGDPSSSGAVADTLAPGEQRTIPNALPCLRSLGLPIPEAATFGSQGGVLLVKFEGAESEDSIAATARTTTATASPQPAGAAGLSYLGVAPAAGSEGSLTLYALRDDPRDRSNVAVYNPGPDPVTVRVTAFSGDGTGYSSVVRDGLTIPGFGWTQLSNVFSGIGITNGWVTVARTSSSGRFDAYGVINDNATNDGSFVVATPSTASGTRLTVPVLVETSSFQSELVLTNRGSTTATLTLRYVEGLTPALGAGGTATVQLKPREQQVIPGAIEYLRRHGMAIGATGAGSYAGALRISVAGASVADVFAGARTAAPSPAGGQFGLFTPGVYQSDEAEAEAYVYGLRADAATRSNLAVVHTGTDADVTLEIQVHDGDRGGVPAGAPLVLKLSPGRWEQVSGILGSVGVRNGWVTVRRSSGTGPWLAYGTVIDGAAPGERTGDGSYVPMTVKAEGNEITITLPGGVPLVLVRIPAGTFQMGAAAGERGTSPTGWEQPQHTVTLTQDFYLGKYEVTQAQWLAVMETNPSLYVSCGGGCPVEQVSWESVRGTAGFIAKVNQLMGTTKFRLPTEAEWERAARGGTQTRFSFGDALDGDDACGANAAASPYVWWCGTSGSSPAPVGTKSANPYGLFDVHGNVWELVEDWFGPYPASAQTDPAGPSTGAIRTIRGGAWSFFLRDTRSASRYFDSPEVGIGVVGFRLARSR